MQFTVQKENLYTGLNTTIRAIAVKNIRPVLSNVLIETIDENFIKISATDLDLSIIINIPALIVIPGSITLPARKLIEIVSKLPDKPVNFTLNTENNIVNITCEKSKFDLLGIPAGEFPPILQLESNESVDIEIEPLLKAIKQTAFTSANYDSNNVLSGVFCLIKDNSLEMVATDGNRLSKSVKTITNKENKEYSIIIPSRTLVEFTRVLSGVNNDTVSVTVQNNQISFNLQDRQLISRLLDGQYPKYNQLIPSNYEVLAKIDKTQLISSLERTSTMVNERTSIVKLIFTGNNLQLMAETPDLGDSSDQIDIEYQGDELKIAFNYKYILDVLNVLDSDNIKIELSGSLSATLIKPDSEEDYLYLIMPVQIR
ncbi:MAG: DNA polymerase III subunit beta [Candidatus Gastranaerophilales bacterium]|nr:DNA polymerase III subunit beta [Candidatus Gastranaerophilales bacterium]